MHEELNNVSAQHDLKQLLGLKEKKRSKMIVDWLLGDDIGRRALAEQLLLSDRPGSAKLLVASSMARWTKLSRRLQLLAAIGRLGLRFDTEEVFDLLAGCRRFGDEFREQAVLLIRKKQDDDEVAMRLATVPGGTKVHTALQAVPTRDRAKPIKSHSVPEVGCGSPSAAAGMSQLSSGRSAAGPGGKSLLQ
jgi:hypothetical protein